MKRLDQEQKGPFLAKLAAITFDDAWDRQMEADAKAGRLDFLWEEAKHEVAERKTRPGHRIEFSRLRVKLWRARQAGGQ